MGLLTALSPEHRSAILRDYRRKNRHGDYRHGVAWVAEKYGLSLTELDALRREAGMAPNGVTLPRRWSCPTCQFRALHPLGHGFCLGDPDLIEWEANQALLVVAAGTMLEQEVA